MAEFSNSEFAFTNGDDNEDSKLCSVRGCQRELPGHTQTKMCDDCKERHRVYATTKRQRRKLEKAAINGEVVMSNGNEVVSNEVPTLMSDATASGMGGNGSSGWRNEVWDPTIDPTLYEPSRSITATTTPTPAPTQIASSSSELANALTLPVAYYHQPPTAQAYQEVVPTATCISPAVLQGSGESTEPPRYCSVKGCKAVIPGSYEYKMCPTCRTRYRGYGVTKRAKWKNERETFERDMVHLRAAEDERRRANNLLLLSENPEELRAWEMSIIDEQVVLPPPVLAALAAAGISADGTPDAAMGNECVDIDPAVLGVLPARMCTVSHCHQILPGYYRYKRCEQHRIQNRHHSKLKRVREKEEKAVGPKDGEPVLEIPPEASSSKKAPVPDSELKMPKKRGRPPGRKATHCATEGCMKELVVGKRGNFCDDCRRAERRLKKHAKANPKLTTEPTPDPIAAPTPSSSASEPAPQPPPTEPPSTAPTKPLNIISLTAETFDAANATSPFRLTSESATAPPDAPSTSAPQVDLSRPASSASQPLTIRHYRPKSGHAPVGRPSTNQPYVTVEQYPFTSLPKGTATDTPPPLPPNVTSAMPATSHKAYPNSGVFRHYVPTPESAAPRKNVVTKDANAAPAHAPSAPVPVVAAPTVPAPVPVVTAPATPAPATHDVAPSRPAPSIDAAALTSETVVSDPPAPPPVPAQVPTVVAATSESVSTAAKKAKAARKAKAKARVTAEKPASTAPASAPATAAASTVTSTVTSTTAVATAPTTTVVPRVLPYPPYAVHPYFYLPPPYNPNAYAYPGYPTLAVAAANTFVGGNVQSAATDAGTAAPASKEAPSETPASAPPTSNAAASESTNDPAPAAATSTSAPTSVSAPPGACALPFPYWPPQHLPYPFPALANAAVPASGAPPPSISAGNALGQTAAFPGYFYPPPFPYSASAPPLPGFAGAGPVPAATVAQAPIAAVPGTGAPGLSVSAPVASGALVGTGTSISAPVALGHGKPPNARAKVAREPPKERRFSYYHPGYGTTDSPDAPTGSDVERKKRRKIDPAWLEKTKNKSRAENVEVVHQQEQHSATGQATSAADATMGDIGQPVVPQAQQGSTIVQSVEGPPPIPLPAPSLVQPMHQSDPSSGGAATVTASAARNEVAPPRGPSSGSTPQLKPCYNNACRRRVLSSSVGATALCDKCKTRIKKHAEKNMRKHKLVPMKTVGAGGQS